MNMQDYTTPFAINGDRDEFSIDTDPNGNVSIERGWTEPYQLRPEEGGKFIPRRIFNQMMNLVSTDTVTWKIQTFPNWIADKGNGTPYAYPKNVIVKYTDGNVYVSKVDNNTALPTNATNWSIYDPSGFDSKFVKTTGNQTISGVKTFSSTIAGSINGNSATATKLQTAITINGVAFDGTENIIVSDSTAVKLTGNQTIAGVKTFSSFPVTPSSAPATSYETANKKYVDDMNNINALPDEATPVDTDNLAIQEVGGNLKKVSYKNLTKLSPNDSRVKTALNASGDSPIYACRAWVNFDGTTNPPTIRASGNVSSVVKIITGGYTINFITPMQDVGYSAVGAVGATSGNHPWVETLAYYTSRLTLYVTRSTTSASGPDVPEISLSIFR